MPSAARKGKLKTGTATRKKPARGRSRPERKGAGRSASAARPSRAPAAPPAKPARPAGRPSEPAASGKGAAAAKPPVAGPAIRPGVVSARPAPGPSSAVRPVSSPRPAGSGGKKARKSSLAQRIPGFVPGDLLVPGGAQGPDEVQYFLRGVVAAEHASIEGGVTELVTKKGTPEGEADHERQELTRYAEGLAERFESGAIEPLLPSRAPARRNFAGVVERAKHRRREIGAFLRGLDLGRTETSHMDSHGEASLQSLMEWAARLENLAEADEPDQADYAMFHRGLDQLENTTEALILDVELTLRRLRDRVRSS